MDAKTTLHITLQERVEVLEKDSDLPEPPSHPVDGGARAWCTLFGGTLMAMVTFGYVNAFGVYQDIYTRSQAATASNVSWIGSTQLFFLFAMGLPAGKLLDMGYLRQTNLVGSLIYVFSLCMVSLAHTDTYYQVYLSQGVGLGIGAGLLYVPAVAVQAHHWKRRRAFAMGVVVTGSSLGGIVFPIMLNQLFQSSVGFEWGVRASAFVVLGLLVAANLLMSDNPSVKSAGEKPVLKNILTDIPFMLTSFGVFVITWGIFFPYFYIQLFAVLHGVDPKIAFYSLAIMNAAGLPGRIFPGLLADRFGPFNIIVPVLLVNAALIFSLFGVSNEGGIVAFVVLYGAFSGAFVTLWAPCAAALAVHPNEVGIRFGVGYFMSAFGALIGTPINGALLGETFLWSKPIIFSGVSIFAGFVCIATARQYLVRKRGSHLV
ncbi:Proton-linked Monocarboxylate Transporter [Pleurotus pulmonarius]